MGGSFDDLGPPALRSHVLAAMFQACTEMLEAADPEFAAVVYLLRGRVSAARGESGVAEKDFQMAAASQDPQVMYAAARELLKLPSISPEENEIEAAHSIWKRAAQSIPSEVRAGYTRVLHQWWRQWPLYQAGLYATSDQIESWMRGGNHRNTSRALILPALELFYAEAAKLGYRNPMAEVKQHLEVASSLGVVRQGETQVDGGDVVS